MRHWEDDGRFNVEKGVRSAGIAPTWEDRYGSLPPERERAVLRKARRQTYLIAIEGTTLVKIGVTSNPARRLSTLQVGQPAGLALLWTHPGDHERTLHAAFAHCRTRGEWFDFGALGDPVAAVEAVLKP